MRVEAHLRSRVEQRLRERARIHLAAADHRLQVDVMDVDHRGKPAIIIAASGGKR
jgi:hypothetical protein